MTPTLEDRFFTFCRRFPDAEEIDVVVAPETIPTGLKIADFLFEKRSIVCEVKTLTNETGLKLARYMEQNGIGPSQLGSGIHIIRDLFLQMDDGERKFQKAITLITTPLCDGVDEAEKQIRDTKQLLDLPNADGLVVILNERVTLAGPPLIMERLAQRLAKKTADGAPYHKNLTHFLHIGEKYTLGDENNFLNLSLSNPLVTEQNSSAAFTQRLMKEWAHFNGQSFAMASPEHEELLHASKLFISVKLEAD